MDKKFSFQDHVIVACGILNMELNQLKEKGLLDAREILYTRPGLHQVPFELEEQLIKQLKTAKKIASNIIVVYGGTFCYVNTIDPYRKIDTIIQEQIEPGINISRVNATHCVDMLVSEEERDRISNGNDIYWLTPGWMKYRDLAYRGWDKTIANENFPRHTGGATMLDAVGYYEKTAENDPEKLLEFSDWMGIPMEPYPTTLNRLFSLLMDAANKNRSESALHNAISTG